MGWFFIICVILGILLGSATNWFAKSFIDDKTDRWTVGWRLLVTCWCVIVFCMAFTVKMVLDESDIKDRQIDQLEQRIEQLENLNRVEVFENE